MTTNQSLIQKADMALADLATAGHLNPEQTDRFIRTLMDSPTILNSVRTVAMRTPEMKINKIGFGSRILRPAVEATALAASDRAKPDLSQVVLNTKEVIAEIRIPYAVLEDNIEGGNINVGMEQGAGGLHQTIVDMIAERAAVDLEELLISGDTASADPYLALQDGYLKMASANVLNAASATISKDLLKNVVKTMPAKYLRNRAALKHFVSVNNETELRDLYANRVGSFGDSNLQGALPLYIYGSQVQAAPLMPAANDLFTDPLNLIFGIQRQITIEYDKDITTRTFIIVLTTRVATAIEEKNAVVKVVGMTG
jgi:HK97 family phage major capsid protein